MAIPAPGTVLAELDCGCAAKISPAGTALNVTYCPDHTRPVEELEQLIERLRAQHPRVPPPYQG